MNLINLLSFILAVVAYSLKELQSFGKLKWIDEKHQYSFWGSECDKRKYKTIPDMDQMVKTPGRDRRRLTFPPKNNAYYRFFKISHLEKFPLSATALVFLTDGYHLAQFAFKLFLILTLVTYEPIFNMVGDFIIYFVGFGVVFSVTYKYLSK